MKRKFAIFRKVLLLFRVGRVGRGRRVIEGGGSRGNCEEKIREGERNEGSGEREIYVTVNRKRQPS
jgi:hypothetical protein